MKINLEKSLAIFAIILGLLAAVAGDPYKANQVKIVEVELNETNTKFVNVHDLAEWIIQKQNEFDLIDIRKNKDFNKYHIPFSYNIPFDSLTTRKFNASKKNILYWKNEKLPKITFQLINDLKMEDIYILSGGLKEWYSEILFPNVADTSVKDQEKIEQIKRTSLFFGGKPKTGDRLKTKPKKKYKREGC
jgi:rhodanese-related sulfurtransferase